MFFIGYWSDFRRVEKAGISEENFSKEKPKNKDKILDYLNSAIQVVTFRTLFEDVLNMQNLIAASDYTDGVYVWSSELVFYYKKYNLILPSDFIEHMEKNNFLLNDSFCNDNFLKKVSAVVPLPR